MGILFGGGMRVAHVGGGRGKEWGGAGSQLLEDSRMSTSSEL